LAKPEDSADPQTGHESWHDLTVSTTRMLLIRHGDSYSKTDGVYAGPRACRGLTGLGREQAARLRDRLVANGIKPEAVYSSPIHRAAQTGGILAEAFPRSSPVRDCGLCSYHLDDSLDGLSWDRIRAEFQHRDEAGRPDGGVFTPFEEGNESWAELVARVGRALTSLAARHAGGTVIAAMHKESVEASLIAFGALRCTATSTSRSAAPRSPSGSPRTIRRRRGTRAPARAAGALAAEPVQRLRAPRGLTRTPSRRVLASTRA
jgi:broad specificity phosphatase PhoE